MEFASALYGLLTVGAGLAASGAASEFGKGAGKAAFEALKGRLSRVFGVEEPNEAALAKPEIAADDEVRRLAALLLAAIEAAPEHERAPYAVDIREIRSKGALRFLDVEGVKADVATSEGDMTFENVKTPPGKR